MRLAWLPEIMLVAVGSLLLLAPAASADSPDCCCKLWSENGVPPSEPHCDAACQDGAQVVCDAADTTNYTPTTCKDADTLNCVFTAPAAVTVDQYKCSKVDCDDPPTARKKCQWKKSGTESVNIARCSLTGDDCVLQTDVCPP